MSNDISGLCKNHSFEAAADLCRLCGIEFCDECLVHPFGKPLCKPCAMAAGGVRTGAALQPINKRDLRKRLKAFETKRALRRQPEEVAPILTGPLNGHDPIGPPLGDGMDKLGETGTPSQEEPVDAGALSAANAPLTGAATAGPQSTEPEQTPGREVAPPIDWSNPFA